MLAAVITPLELRLVLLAVLVVLALSRLPRLVRTLRSGRDEEPSRTAGRSTRGLPAEPAG